MKLKDTPAVKAEVPKYNDLKDSNDDARVQRAVGEVYVKDVELHTSPAQPEPDTKHGAQGARERKLESEATEGTHVHAGGDPKDHRGAYVAGEYARNAEKVHGESGRKTMKEVAAKSKGV